MKRQVGVRGYFRTHQGKLQSVAGHRRTINKRETAEITKETVKVDYSNLEDVSNSPESSGWKPCRVQPAKAPFFERLFRKDFDWTSSSDARESDNPAPSCFRRIFVNVGNDGTGKMSVHYDSMTNEENPEKKVKPVKVKIGPYADLTKLGAIEKGRNFGGTDKGWDAFDLNGANLKGCKASGVSWGGANLSNTNFEGSDLSGSHLAGADLQNSILREANLENADLHRSNLAGADLSHANLSGANLSGANLMGVNWEGVKMDGAILLKRENGVFYWPPEYDEYNFYDAAKALGLTNNQMEFLIMSRGIEVRDNVDFSVITENFNPNHHHVVPWAIQNWVPTNR